MSTTIHPLEHRAPRRLARLTAALTLAGVAAIGTAAAPSQAAERRPAQPIEGSADVVTLRVDHERPGISDAFKATPSCTDGVDIDSAAVDIDTGLADVDGDGVDDLATVYRVGDQRSLHIAFASGGSDHVDLGGPGIPIEPEVSNGIDLDGDGREGVIVRLGTDPDGDDSEFYVAFGVVDCHIQQIDFADL